MAKIQWLKTRYPGVRYHRHDARKHGVQKDKSFHIRFKGDGELYQSSLGWSSEGMTAEKASLKLAEYKQNFKAGKQPRTIIEERELAEAQAQAEEDAQAESERQQAITDKKSMTLSALFHDQYIPFVKAEGKKSWAQELSLFKTWIEKPLGAKSISSISPIDIERVKHTVGKKRSERTTQYCLAIIRRVFNFAVMRDFYDGMNPTKKVKFPTPDNGRVRFFTRDQAEELISTLQEHSPQLSEMTEVSLFSGLRWGEVAGLTWMDVNLDQRTLFIRDPKNKHSRSVPMPVRLQKMFQGKRTGNDVGLVFPGKKGERSIWVSKTIKRTIADLGWNDGVTDNRQRLTFHSCRHSFCSWLAMEGVPLHTIGTLAGHRNLKMTERYSHLLPDTLLAAVDLLDKKEDPASKMSKVVNLR